MSRGAPAVAILFASALAFAQDAPDPAARREANAFLREGNRLFRQGDAEGALDLFRRAFERFPSPRVQLNVATALGALGRDVEAAEAYERVLAAPPEEIPADMRREVEAALAEVDRKLARIRISVGTDGAAVSIDGRPAGTSPLAAPVRVAPGRHVVAAALAGGPPAEANVEVAAGETANVSLAISPGAPVREPGTEPEPMTRPDLRVRAEPAAPAAPAPEPEETPSIWGRWWLWAGVGAIAVGAVTAAILLSGGSEAGREPTELGTIP